MCTLLFINTKLCFLWLLFVVLITKYHKHSPSPLNSSTLTHSVEWSKCINAIFLIFLREWSCLFTLYYFFCLRGVVCTLSVIYSLGWASVSKPLVTHSFCGCNTTALLIKYFKQNLHWDNQIGFPPPPVNLPCFCILP